MLARHQPLTVETQPPDASPSTRPSRQQLPQPRQLRLPSLKPLRWRGRRWGRSRRGQHWGRPPHERLYPRAPAVPPPGRTRRPPGHGEAPQPRHGRPGECDSGPAAVFPASPWRNDGNYHTVQLDPSGTLSASVWVWLVGCRSRFIILNEK